MRTVSARVDGTASSTAANVASRCVITQFAQQKKSSPARGGSAGLDACRKWTRTRLLFDCLQWRGRDAAVACRGLRGAFAVVGLEHLFIALAVRIDQRPA